MNDARAVTDAAQTVLAYYETWTAGRSASRIDFPTEYSTHRAAATLAQEIADEYTQMVTEHQSRFSIGEPLAQFMRFLRRVGEHRRR